MLRKIKISNEVDTSKKNLRNISENKMFAMASARETGIVQPFLHSDRVTL